jgi:CheY-like chemotaxis protein
VTSGQKEILEKTQSVSKTKNQERIQCNVLIVDDEKDLREIFQFIVSKICSHVVVAESAQEGNEIISRGGIDIVFSDIKMPKLNGFDFLRMISENKNITQPKFVFLTGGVELTKEELNIIQTKTNGLLTKPLVLEDVIKTINELFPDRVPIK